VVEAPNLTSTIQLDGTQITPAMPRKLNNHCVRYPYCRTKGDLKSKLQVVNDQNGRPLQILCPEGQLSDNIGARLIFEAKRRAKVLIADKGYYSDDSMRLYRNAR
jgi:hypothetical protein